MKSRSVGVTARAVSALSLLVPGFAWSQVTEDAASELVAAFDSAADNLWRDTGPAGRSYVHRQGFDANGIGFNQVAVPVGGVTIAGQCCG